MFQLLEPSVFQALVIPRTETLARLADQLPELSHRIYITKNKCVLNSLIPSLTLLSSRQHEKHPLQLFQLFVKAGKGKSINPLINKETAVRGIWPPLQPMGFLPAKCTHRVQQWLLEKMLIAPLGVWSEKTKSLGSWL